MLPIYQISVPKKEGGQYVFTVTDPDGNEELVECPPSFGRYRAEVHRQKTRQYLEGMGDVEMEGGRSCLATLGVMLLGVVAGIVALFVLAMLL